MFYCFFFLSFFSSYYSLAVTGEAADADQPSVGCLLPHANLVVTAAHSQNVAHDRPGDVPDDVVESVQYVEGPVACAIQCLAHVAVPRGRGGQHLHPDDHPAVL